MAFGATAAAAAIVVSGCASSSGSSGSDSKDGGSAAKVSITLTPDGCAPSPASVAAGLITFEVTNKNASAVSEAELLRGDTIMGEKENLTPGLSGKFSLRLILHGRQVCDARKPACGRCVLADLCPSADPAALAD